MQLTLTPIFWPGQNLVLNVHGDALVINGETFDFSPLALGHEVPVDNPFFCGPVSRTEEGELQITVCVPYYDHTEAPDVQVLDNPKDGNVVYRLEPNEEPDPRGSDEAEGEAASGVGLDSDGGLPEG